MTDAADFYTGLVAEAYGALKSETFDADRYAAFVRAHGEPALEVGCGDGHPLLELVARGHDVDGVDSSADMIHRAQTAAHARGLDVGLHTARMEQMDLGRVYRSIYLAGPTFQLLPDDDTAAGALAAFGRHLTPGGRVMIPLWIPEPTPAAQLGVAREATDGDGNLLRFTALAEELDTALRTRRTQVRYERIDATGHSAAIEREWIIHWQTPRTIETLAAGADLVVDHLESPPEGQGQAGDQFTAYLGRS